MNSEPPITNTLERTRLKLQDDLDSCKSTPDRNAMGQFATPSKLAHAVLEQAKQYLPEERSIRFLDPAIGTGAFFSALRSVFPASRVKAARGYEVDEHYGMPASELWRNCGLDLRLEDFTRAHLKKGEASFDLVICNPPYVRHHHLGSGDKARLRARAISAAGIEFSGLSGLYCYFMALTHSWMAPRALAGWLIPSEFMDVNYGAAVKRYLLDRVTLLHIHRFDPEDVQFGDALVSSAVVWFRNERPPSGNSVRMTYGGSLTEPRKERTIEASELRDTRKWTGFPSLSSRRNTGEPTLSDFFCIKRGLATGDNKFFILDEAEATRRQLPWNMLRPILPSPRNLVEDEIASDDSGNPLLDRRLFLLDCRLPDQQVQREYPTLWKYLEEGRERGVADRYICRNRSPWYVQESRPAAPFVCTYLGRTRSDSRKPFRFILNRSLATAANVYLMLYPTEPVASALSKDSRLQEQTWGALRSIGEEALLGEGRVYGGGLRKLEPRELANVPSAALGKLFPEVSHLAGQPDLFSELTTVGALGTHPA